MSFRLCDIVMIIKPLKCDCLAVCHRAGVAMPTALVSLTFLISLSYNKMILSWFFLFRFVFIVNG